MAARTACKLHIMDSLPVINNSAGILQTHIILPPISLETDSLTSVREGPSSLMGGSSTRIRTAFEFRITVGVSTWYDCSKYSAQRFQTPTLSEMNPSNCWAVNYWIKQNYHAKPTLRNVPGKNLLLLLPLSLFPFWQFSGVFTISQHSIIVM